MYCCAHYSSFILIYAHAKTPSFDTYFLQLYNVEKCKIVYKKHYFFLNSILAIDILWENMYTDAVK